MKLEKAIEFIDTAQKGENIIKAGNLHTAIKLVNEAAKRLLAWRNDNDEDLLWDLPGETEE